MIKHVEIQNFRSIQNSKFSFSDSGLTVIVGANGSGKSNLVKSLQFISQINNDGLSLAIAAQGGALAVIPKAVDEKSINNVKTSIKYKILQRRPPGYPSNRNRPSGTHSIVIDWADSSDFTISEETVTYQEPIAVAKALESKDKDYEITNARKSSIRFTRDDKNIYMQSWPNFNGNNRQDYIRWIGLPEYLLKDIEYAHEFNKLISKIGSTFKKQGHGLDSKTSLIKWKKSLLNYSVQNTVFMNEASGIKRFDLQLTELRKAQQYKGKSNLSRLGDNLPSAVRLAKEDSSEDWERLLLALQELAPHITSLETNKLRTGQEYISFIENEVGRPVESWDSSDGTLRALAVLIALETHPEGNTIVIEEPELGLHPWAVSTIMEYARDVISRRNLQIVMTTHSQQVLQSINPEELVVTSRTEESGTEISRLSDFDSIDIGSLRQGDVGRMWVKGLLQGIPQY
jgi:predicted ATPase